MTIFYKTVHSVYKHWWNITSEIKLVVFKSYENFSNSFLISNFFEILKQRKESITTFCCFILFFLSPKMWKSTLYRPLILVTPSPLGIGEDFTSHAKYSARILSVNGEHLKSRNIASLERGNNLHLHNRHKVPLALQESRCKLHPVPTK